jgi:hypothetical protein
MVALPQPSEQRDHHCILVAQGTPCRIVQVEKDRILVECAQGCCCGFIDTSASDFDAYCAAAVMNDFANALSADRGVPVAVGSGARN